MQITRDMSLDRQIQILRADLKAESARLDFWQRKCEGPFCNATQVHAIVADEYFDTPFDAISTGIRYHMFLCKHCVVSQIWRGVLTILRRPTVSIRKVRKCTHAANDCPREATVFFYTGCEGKGRTDEKRWFCVNHGAIYSVDVFMFQLGIDGKEIDFTLELEEFYVQHIRPGIIRAQYKGE